jgi:transcription factor SPN1
MWQAIVDSRLLEAVSSWLEPMRPSGTLPAEGIQKALFEVLPRVRRFVHFPSIPVDQQMEIDAQTLKESYLGRVVLFYTKAPRVQGPIKRQADNLVQAWSRPILGRSSDMRNRKVVNIKDIDLTAAAEDIDMANTSGVGGEESQGQSQTQTQTQSQGASQSQKPKKKRVDWNERAEINTTAKGARLEKASVCYFYGLSL